VDEALAAFIGATVSRGAEGGPDTRVVKISPGQPTT
jgi:hypothetical protein